MGSTRHRRTPFVIVLLLLAALAVSLIAGLASATAEESASPAAADGGKVIYRVGWTGDADNLNPFIGYVSPSFEVWYLTYDSLIGYDPATLSPTEGENATGLATSWTTSEDGLVWTFTLRQNATWDDGQPLTANDVAFTYNYIIQNEMENFTAYTNLIDEAVVIDDYTVEFRCSKPKPDMIRHWVPILPEHVWGDMSPKEAGKNFQNPPPIVGSGPFKCMEWKKNDYIKMVKNPTWWGAEPKIDEIYFMYFTNADTMVQDLKSGNIDGCVDLNASQMGLFDNNPEIEARAIAIDGFNELGFNCYDGPSGAHPAIKDWKFRQALNWACDLQKGVDLTWGGYTVPGTTIIPPDYYSDPDWHWDPPAEVKYTYDPEMAKQKLDEAGYLDSDGDGVREYEGEPIELGLISRVESTESQQLAKLIAGWFKDVGIKVKVETMDEGALMDKMYNYEGDTFTPDLDMFLWGWYLDYDPGSMLSYFTKDQIENWSDCNWWDPEYEELYQLQSEELDPAKRKEYIDRMQQILYEQTPYIVTDYGPDFEAFNIEKWEGYIYIPDPNGNALIPPFGNGGYANFLSIQPKTADTAAEEGGNTTLWIALAAGAVIVVLIIVFVLRARKPQAMEE
ncbi:MAG TPA: ABC transporter substrate-binding protein [Thermoleophilia bacterium]|nr:ABC transporter substrate-binding protein [Thermoleophilia bacterium]